MIFMMVYTEQFSDGSSGLGLYLSVDFFYDRSM